MDRHTLLNIISYADDLMLITKTEDELQRLIYRLSEVCEDYGMKITTKKTKVMAFIGNDQVGTKIVISEDILEQVSHFNYLGCTSQ